MCQEVFQEDAGAYLSLLDMNASMDTIRGQAAFPSIDLAIRALSLQDRKTNGKAPLYYYNFDAEIPGWDNAGTFHSVDLWFFFETLAKCWRPFVGKHYDLARQMCNYWANFMKKGDPNGLDSNGQPMPYWEAWTEENNACMIFDDSAHMAVEEKPDEKMALLVRHYLRRHGC